jgi:hypothetical protein
MSTSTLSPIIRNHLSFALLTVSPPETWLS